jgi:hypothetical protein
MRTIIICAAVLLFFGTTDAQVLVGVNFNIGRQPVWGPVGYDYVEYYYIPDIDVFYYVPTHRFVYLEGRRWIFRANLPARFGRFDLFTIHKEVINKDRPYLRHQFYRDKFIRYRGLQDQQIIRDSHDSKYFVVRGHPEHNKWLETRGQRMIRDNHGHWRGNGERGHGNIHGRDRNGKEGK